MSNISKKIVSLSIVISLIFVAVFSNGTVSFATLGASGTSSIYIAGQCFTKANVLNQDMVETYEVTEADLEEDTRSGIVNMYLAELKALGEDITLEKNKLHVKGKDGATNSTKFMVYIKPNMSFTDGVGNKWNGNKVEVINEWENDGTEKVTKKFLVNVSLDFNSNTTQPNNTLNVPSKATISGTEYVICALRNIGRTASVVKIPKTIVSIEDTYFSSFDDGKRPTLKFDSINNMIYAGENSLSYASISADDVNVLINNGAATEKYVFYSSNISGKLSLTNGESVIGSHAFEKTTGITGIEVSKNVKTLTLKDYAFNSSKNLSIVGLEVKNTDTVDIGEYAFANISVSGDWKLNGDVYVGKNAFEYSMQGLTTIQFSKGNVIFKEKAFIYTDNLSGLIFDETCGNIEICANAFRDINEARKLTTLEFCGTGDVTLDNEAFAAFPTLKSLEFNNKGTVNFKENPFCEEDKPYNHLNSNLTQISFNCSSVKSEKSKKYLSTFYGLSKLATIVCQKNVSEFNIYRILHGWDVYDSSCGADSNLNLFVFYNPNIIPDICDSTKVDVTYQGLKNISAYCSDINNKKISNHTNTATFKQLAYGESLVVRSKDDTDNLVLAYGQSMDKSRLNVGYYLNDGAQTPTFYQLEDSDYELKELKNSYTEEEGGNVTYVAIYGDKNDYQLSGTFTVNVSPNYITDMSIHTASNDLIEGQTLSKEDFVFDSITYSNAKQVTNDCASLVDDSLVITVNGKENGKLVEGNDNVIVISYQKAEVTLKVSARKKAVKEITSVKLLDTGITYYEQNTIPEGAVKVDVLYDNGDTEEDYKEFTLINNKLVAGDNSVTVSAGNAKKSFNVYAERLKVISIEAFYNGGNVAPGQQLDQNKLTVTAHYNDVSHTRELNKDEYHIAKYTIVEGSTIPVYIIYNEDTSILTEILIEGVKAQETQVPVYTETAKPTDVVTSMEPIVSDTPSETTKPTEEPTGMDKVTTPPVAPAKPEETVQPTNIPATNVPTATTGAGISVNDNDKVPNAGGNITPESPSTVATDLGKVTLGVKENCTLTVKGADIASYSSSDNNVAAVTSTGKITAVKVGTAVITVTTTTGAKGTYTVTVKKAPKKIGASFKKKTLKKGKQITLKPKFAAGYYSNKVTYKSSNKKIATVSSKGVIKAKKKGTCKITMTTYNGKKVTVTITVK